MMKRQKFSADLIICYDCGDIQEHDAEIAVVLGVEHELNKIGVIKLEGDGQVPINVGLRVHIKDI